MNALNLVFERVISHRFVSGNVRKLFAPMPRLHDLMTYRVAEHNELISFDAFDTLITRPLQRPADLFLLCGYKLKASFDSPVEPEEWLKIRQSAESRARKSAVEHEVTLLQIYGEIAASADLSAALLETAQEIEVGLEKLLSRPIAAMVEAFNACATQGRTAIISDIYLSRPDLDAMLQRCGVHVKPADLYISCESGQTKRTSSLFAVAKGASKRHLHVGDNVFSDLFQVWLSRGRAAPFFKASPTRLERALGNDRIEPPLLRSALSGSARTARLRVGCRAPHEQSLAEVSAGFTAPLLLTFVVWILKQAERKQIERLFFLARDGQILLSMARKIARAYHLPVTLDYLYVSRQSLHLPALSSVAADDLTSFGFRPGQSLADVLRKFGIDVAHPAVVRFLQRHDIHSPRAPMNALELDAILAGIRCDAELTQLIDATAASARELLLDYLRQKGFCCAGNVGLVDIGWRGNLQRSLAQVARSGDAGFNDRLSGFYFGLYHRPANCGSLDDFLGASVAAPIRPYVRGSMFEALCAADHGTTTGYERTNDGTVVPKLLTADNPEATAWGLKIQHDVVNAYVDDVLAVLTEAGLNLLDCLDGLSQGAATVTRMVVGSPSRGEANALGSFPHASDQLHRVFEEVAPPLSLDARAWWSKLRDRGDAPLISYWPEASVVRAMPSLGASMMLGGLGLGRKLRARR
ncbi:haloacid dehalogenase [Paraburkholderia sp. B3]|uniref:haloacid dehalogenase n=1 Tax=Paraburkholderia sp. B3 TaxID=3134791 RepID=UPI0039825956